MRMKEVRPTTTLLRRAVGLVNGRYLFCFRIKVFDGTGEHVELWCERTNVEDADWAGERIDTERPLAHM